MPFFDNLEDVKTKFEKTIVYYDNRAVLIKAADIDHDNGQFKLLVSQLNGRNKPVLLNDPALDYINYNLGYVNHPGYAAWWFRRPIRQYQQGLRKDQMDMIMSNRFIVLNEQFSFNRNVVNTLENQFPSIETCKEAIMGGQMLTMAFHRDFALSWDKIHEDFILEYRGKQIGASTDVKNFKLSRDCKYMEEPLYEALCTP